MNTSLEELRQWEHSHNERNMKRLFKTAKNYRCPRKKRLLDYRRKNISSVWTQKEDTRLRVDLNRRFRRKMKQRIHEEIYYRPVPHDYKTYGWLSW